MVMIYAGGHISGAHYNPAVSLAVLMRGKVSINNFIPYIIAQVLGSVAAAYAVMFFIPTYNTTALASTTPQIFLAEFLFTFALAYVVLNVATSKGTTGNSFYGLAIGSTVTVGAYAVGAISGGAFNPAVSIGASLMGLANMNLIPVYFIAQLAGAGVAAVVFKIRPLHN